MATEAEILLGEIDRWVVATGCGSGQLGQMVLNHGGFVPLLRKRGTVRPETMARVRAFMAQFARAEALQAEQIALLIRQARAGSPWTPAAQSGSAPGEPAASPDPLGKPRVSAAVIRAARIDGRDLPTFVTALIDMGLECWRDDRLAHEEEVA